MYIGGNIAFESCQRGGAFADDGVYREAQLALLYLRRSLCRGTAIRTVPGAPAIRKSAVVV